MEITNKQWKEFSLIEIFDTIQRGKRLKKDDHIEGKLPYASSTASNNGIDGFIGNTRGVRTFDNCLTIANSGSVGSTFYQPFNVIASDHVTKLENKKFNKYTYLFLATIISRLSEKYSFNREINDQRIQKEKILLPVNSKGKPDYAFMESYMKKKEKELLEKYKNYISVKTNKKMGGINLNSKIGWGEFFIDDLFKIKIGKNIDGNKINKQSGEFAYITRKESNNGLDGFTNFHDGFLNTDYPVITIGNETAEPFVQKYPFFTGTKVNILIPRTPLNPKVLFFIISSLKTHKSKYSYSFTINSTRLKRQKILLPTNNKGKPDYLFMENYIKNLEYEKLKLYLGYKKTKSR